MLGNSAPDDSSPLPVSKTDPIVRTPSEQMPQMLTYLALVNQILADVASSYDADISTLFRVSNDRALLSLEAVFDMKGQVEVGGTPPYRLEWPDPEIDTRKRHGVTCWVAEHGLPLFMPSLAELRKHRAYAGFGAWDNKLFADPGGVDDENSGFGCFYAVPLRTGDGLPREKVIGVFKIERRRGKPIFDVHERKAFDLAATSISRTLQMYLVTANTLRRVLSEAAHILRGRLSDSLSVIQMCLKLLDDKYPDVGYAQNHLPQAESLLRASCHRIEGVLEAYRDERQVPTEFKLEEIVEAAIEAGVANKEYCRIEWKIPKFTTLRLTSIQRYDLETVLLNLLRNAEQHSASEEAIRLVIWSQSQPSCIGFDIADRGKGIDGQIIDRARSASTSETEEGILLLVRGGRTGLRRVFRFAAQYGWDVIYTSPSGGGSHFTVKVPKEVE